MKKRALTAVLLSAVMLCACGNGGAETVTVAETTAAETVTEDMTEAVTDPDTTGGVITPDEPFSVDVRPVPLRSAASDGYAYFKSLTPSADGYDGIFDRFGFDTGADGLAVEIKDDGSADEEYRLSVRPDGITIYSGSKSGVFNAVSTLAQLRRGDFIAACEIEDKPSVAFRGVIEGFYGTAWTHEYRLNLFDFMGEYKLNSYMYAPKDDAKHRARWRELYTGKELERMKELIDGAAKNNVRFIYALSPGLDFDLGSGFDRDFEKLVKKCESMYGLGVRDFAILLDDIETHDAKGHARLVNDFQNKFVKTHENCADLIMITPEFCGAMTTGYTDEITKLLDPDIFVMWTGDSVVPPSMSANDLKKINDRISKNAYIWWNYPVNDMDKNRLFMGPCVNLGKNLSSAISGLVSNPMNQGYASFVPLFTVADYLWNTERYDPEDSFLSASRHIEPDCAEGLYEFADLTRASYINGEKSSSLISPLINEYEKSKENGDKLLEKLSKTLADLKALSEKGNARLIKEIKPWLEKAVNELEAAAAYVRYEKSGDKADAFAFIKPYTSALDSTVVVSGDALIPFLTSKDREINGAFTGSAAVKFDKIKTSWNTYDKYVPEYAVDGAESTFFWSAGAANANDYFQIELAEETKLGGVRLLMSDKGHNDDYIQKGVIEYSTNGKDYAKLCDINGRKTEYSGEFTARYVRARSTGQQVNWVIITEFELIRPAVLPDGASFDGDAYVNFTPLFDGNVFTVFSPDKKAVNGKTLTLDAAGKNSAEILLTDPSGVTVRIKTADKESDIELTYYNVIDLTGAESLSIGFGNKKPGISEIIIK